MSSSSNGIGGDLVIPALKCQLNESIVSMRSNEDLKKLFKATLKRNILGEKHSLFFFEERCEFQYLLAETEDCTLVANQLAKFYTKPSGGGEFKKRWDCTVTAAASGADTTMLPISRYAIEESKDTCIEEEVGAKLIKLFEALQECRTDILTIISIKGIPDFLESITAERCVRDSVPRSFEDEDGMQSPTEKSNQVCKCVDEFRLERVLSSRSWIHDLMCAVENLPVCVSLASARASKGMGFPLVYVNSHFEEVCGYGRSEIIGQSCRFLQNHLSEPSSIAVLSAGLREARPVKVQITNCRKDGSVFKNLLAMKPIFDQDGVYCYVLALQFSIATEEEGSIKLVLLSSLLSMFPETVLETHSSTEEEELLG